MPAKSGGSIKKAEKLSAAGNPEAKEKKKQRKKLEPPNTEKPTTNNGNDLLGSFSHHPPFQHWR